MMSARGRPLRPAWSRRSPQCRGRLVPHPLRQWGKVWRAASARQQQDRLRSTLGRGEIQYAQWPTFNVRRGGVCRHRPLLPPPPCRRSCAELRGGFLGEVWRGAAGRVAARSGHGGRAHMGGMSMMMGMVRSRGRCGGRGGCEVDAHSSHSEGGHCPLSLSGPAPAPTVHLSELGVPTPEWTFHSVELGRPALALE